tara:strand:+ start:313 stop:963 length:651 start_codon:yes stop_codon:yes gene_type:complete
MATFGTQVEDLTGSLSDNTALTQWLTDGARLVLDNLPLDKLERVTEHLDFTDSTSSQGKRIHQVLRQDASNGNKKMPCRKLSPAFLGKVTDSDYMEAATTSDPAYILHNHLIQTFPASASGSDSRVIYIDTSITVAYDANPGSVEDLPQEAEQVVVLYAARNGLERLVSNANADEDPELVASLIGQYRLVDAQYKEGLQVLGIDKLYIEKNLPDRR